MDDKKMIREPKAGFERPPKKIDPMVCSRCDAYLDYAGERRFHEGTRFGVFGDIGELFVNRERFDVYVCPRCGRVEFFIDGIGENFRPH